ncbi:MAG TPA: HEPN domain-containing protein [Gemmataceae bacterium]|nr:HEPN domain-containing protein [Gemmataceae bacterium]
MAVRLAAGATEAEWRSATSRAYYAAFHAARDLFRGLGFVVPRADAAHKYLAFRLQNSGNTQLRDAGRELDDLRQLRNEADYDIGRSYGQHIAHSQVALSQRITQGLAVAAVEPTRTQVRDAMIAYERNVLRRVTWTP